MQFWDNSDSDEDRNSGGDSRPPQRPPNWRKWISPGVLALVMLLVLVSSPGLLGGVNSTPELAYSTVYEQLRQGNVAMFDFRGDTGLNGLFRSGIIVTTTTGRSLSVSRFSASIPPAAATNCWNWPMSSRLLRFAALPTNPLSCSRCFSTSCRWRLSSASLYGWAGGRRAR